MTKMKYKDCKLITTTTRTIIINNRKSKSMAYLINFIFCIGCLFGVVTGLDLGKI